MSQQTERLSSRADTRGDPDRVADEGRLPPSRGCITANYCLITPENWVENALPYFDGTTVRPMATPRFVAAVFGEYLLDFEPSAGTLRPVGAGYESFLYVLEGEIGVETQARGDTLDAESFCFLPTGTEFTITADSVLGARVLWTKRRYEGVEGLAAPTAIYGRQSEVPDIVPDPPAQYVYQELIPSIDRSYDMSMNVLTCPPGGSLGLVEIHHQEHGLYMLSGRGTYYLAGDYHDVQKGDFIYMAPYCPQSFWTTGDEPASYLLYKDVNRDGF